MNDDQAERKAQTRVQFNAVAPQYDAGPGCFAHFGQRLVAVADIEAGQRVLDVATGRGALFFPAIEQVGAKGEVVGIDLADEMVRASNEEAARRGVKSRAQVMDAERLDFPDATFDRVLCGFGVMFFPNQAGAMAEFHRVLKPGGRIAVSTWRITQAHELEQTLGATGVKAPRLPGWITEPEDLSRLISRAGFKNVRVDADAHAFRYATVDEYWQTARGTGMRRILDGMELAQTERARATLAERMRPHQRPDGFYINATALLATGDR